MKELFGFIHSRLTHFAFVACKNLWTKAVLEERERREREEDELGVWVDAFEGALWCWKFGLLIPIVSWNSFIP